MSLSEAFLVPFHTLIKLRYTKALDWSRLVSGPKAKSSSEVTNLTLFTVSDHYSNHNIMACFKGPCHSAGLWVTAPLFSSGQFSRSVVSDSLRPRGLQHARPPCPSPTARLYSNPCPLSHWCHPTISSSVVPFSSRLQSLPASGSFLRSQLFASGGQRIGVSASASALPANKESSPCSAHKEIIWPCPPVGIKEMNTPLWKAGHSLGDVLQDWRLISVPHCRSLLLSSVFWL